MSRLLSHLNTAKTIIQQYDGSVPLHSYLKIFFAKDKKYGSKDRRAISAMCYYYFRVGHGETVRTEEERILLAVYLCEDKPNELLQALKPEWNEQVHLPLQQKLAGITSFYALGLFPWNSETSDGIDAAAFSLSFLIQPRLFIRIRPGRKEIVFAKLNSSAIYFEEVMESCLALENGTRLEDILVVNRDYVVQDYNSQRVGEFMNTAADRGSFVWDCCAASGGKSIMAYDRISGVSLTVSDIRSGILHQLKERFEKAGIEDYHYFIANLQNREKLHVALGSQKFDLVICDAPCTGSGTWGRTPEQLYYFKKRKIDEYSTLQKQIVENVSGFLKPGGFLLYITCSVFRKENEGVVNFIENSLNLVVKKQELLKGYGLRADTLFAALFQSPES